MEMHLMMNWILHLVQWQNACVSISTKHRKSKCSLKVQNVVGDCINNVLEGNPVNGPNQQFRPAVQHNIMRANPPNPAAGDQMGFFQEGRQTITYGSTGDFSFQNL